MELLSVEIKQLWVLLGACSSQRVYLDGFGGGYCNSSLSVEQIADEESAGSDVVLSLVWEEAKSPESPHIRLCSSCKEYQTKFEEA
jgi:hypothetical protein